MAAHGWLSFFFKANTDVARGVCQLCSGGLESKLREYIFFGFFSWTAHFRFTEAQ